MLLESVLSLVFATLLFFFLMFFFLSEKGQQQNNRKPEEDASAASALSKTEEGVINRSDSGFLEAAASAATSSLVPSSRHWFLSPARICGAETTPASHFEWVESLLTYLFAVQITRCTSFQPSHGMMSSSSLDVTSSEFCGDILAAALEVAVSNQPAISWMELVDSTLPWARSGSSHSAPTSSVSAVVSNSNTNENRKKGSVAGIDAEDRDVASVDGHEAPAAGGAESSSGKAIDDSGTPPEMTTANKKPSSVPPTATVEPRKSTNAQLVPTILGEIKSSFKIHPPSSPIRGAGGGGGGNKKDSAFSSSDGEEEDEDPVVAETQIEATIKFDLRCAVELRGEVMPLALMKMKQQQQQQQEADMQKQNQRHHEHSLEGTAVFDSFDSVAAPRYENRNRHHPHHHHHHHHHHHQQHAPDSFGEYETTDDEEEEIADDETHHHHHHNDDKAAAALLMKSKQQSLLDAIPAELLAMSFTLRLDRFCFSGPVHLVLRTHKSGGIFAVAKLVEMPGELELNFSTLLGDELQMSIRQQVKQALINAIEFVVRTKLVQKEVAWKVL